MTALMQEEILKALAVLKKGGTILYPTDTIWGLGCDATNNRAIRKLHKIKQRADHKHFIILLESSSLLSTYVKVIPDTTWDLYQQIDTPLTIVFPGAKNLPRMVIGTDKTVGIRIPKDDFVLELIRAFGKPIISTSANISGEPPPMVFRDISQNIMQAVDHVVAYNQDTVNKIRPSTIIRLNEDGDFEVLRS